MGPALSLPHLAAGLEAANQVRASTTRTMRPLFVDAAERAEFDTRHAQAARPEAARWRTS
jgi:hypothetical protein